MKLEKKSVTDKQARSRKEGFHQFLEFLRDMKVGESFLVDEEKDGYNSNWRNAMSIAQVLLGKTYAVVTESKGKKRIGRVA